MKQISKENGLFLKEEEIHALIELLDYVYHDEQKDYESTDDWRNHIFKSIKTLKNAEIVWRRHNGKL